MIAICVVCGGLFINSHPIQQRAVAADSGMVYTRPVELPAEADFAGENFPLENFDTRESLDRELLVNANFHRKTPLSGKGTPLLFHYRTNFERKRDTRRF